MHSRRFQPTSKQLLRWLITTAALVFIGWQFSTHHALVSGQVDAEAWFPKRPEYVWMTLLLMPLNWGVEVVKWHGLMREHQSDWRLALRQVLAGTALGFITPNRTGEAVARVGLLPATHRAFGARAFVWSAWAQAGVTLTIGWVVLAIILHQPLTPASLIDPNSTVPNGVLSLFQNHPGLFDILWALWAASTVLVGGWWLLGNDKMGRFMASVAGTFSSKFSSRWQERIQQFLTPIPTRTRFVLTGWSVVRYGLFTTQFTWVLMAWGLDGNLKLIQSVVLVFLGNMMIPSAALAELGIREALILAIYNPSTGWMAAAVVATFALWMINLMIPALAGGILHLFPAKTRKS